MTNEVLHINDGTTTIEVFLNNQDKIYIGEVDPSEPMYGFSIAISYDDWKVMRKYIDKQFKGIDR